MAEFHFGLEAEFLLADRQDWRPLWYSDLSFKDLNDILQSIPTDGLPSLEGLELEAPHSKLMPYVVEGYHVPEEHTILPKGLEIRTPVCKSLEQCLEVYRDLFMRLNSVLKARGLALVALSHHPLHTRFRGPRHKRRYDYWLWAMEVMSTYGPDINISFPDAVRREWDSEDILEKINYYAPAMTVFTLASPFCNGGMWSARGCVGKSYRTYRRSIVGPPLEEHPEENGRMEYKTFEMASSLSDFRNQFLMFLALVLDESLTGRALAADRIYEMGEVARVGLEANGVDQKIAELLHSVRFTLPRWGFDVASIATWEKRWSDRVTPADDMLALYRSTGDLRAVLERRSILTM